MNAVALSEILKSKALELGFNQCGVALTSDPMLSTAVDHYKDYLDQNYGSSMQYLNRHLQIKSSPELFLKKARSVVCVSLSYGREAVDLDAEPRISTYAQGFDYHSVMEEKLSVLVESMKKEIPSAQTRVFVDSAPVFDRFWAWRSGLGWIGKNTCLIDRKKGSFFFIGGFFTDIILTEDVPQIDHCGKCSKCIDACPTEAIVELKQYEDQRRPSYSIDSNRCIAYHTIENKGDIDSNLLPKFQTWIAGCDICQTVCPWNKTEAAMNLSSHLQNTNALISRSFLELSQFNPQTYPQAVENTAMSRVKFPRFARNLAIAVVNSSISKEEKLRILGNLKTHLAEFPQVLEWVENV